MHLRRPNISHFCDDSELAVHKFLVAHEPHEYENTSVQVLVGVVAR